MHEKDVINIKDCLFAIEKINKYLSDINSEEAFFSDTETYDAVLMNFIVISEACGRLSNDLKEENKKIEWTKIKGFRNLIAHDYFGLDVREIWSIIIKYLPSLKLDLERIVNS